MGSTLVYYSRGRGQTRYQTLNRRPPAFEILTGTLNLGLSAGAVVSHFLEPSPLPLPHTPESEAELQGQCQDFRAFQARAILESQMDPQHLHVAITEAGDRYFVMIDMQYQVAIVLISNLPFPKLKVQLLFAKLKEDQPIESAETSCLEKHLQKRLHQFCTPNEFEHLIPEGEIIPLHAITSLRDVIQPPRNLAKEYAMRTWTKSAKPLKACFYCSPPTPLSDPPQEWGCCIQ
jgi:hypothetical protein